MKRIIIALFALSLLLCACADQTDESNESILSSISIIESAVSEASDERVTNVFVSHGESGRYLANEYEYPMKSMLFSGGWSEEVPECICDFTIRFPDAVFDYSSQCGTVIWNGLSKRLSNYDKENLNDLLFSAFGIE